VDSKLSRRRIGSVGRRTRRARRAESCLRAAPNEISLCENELKLWIDADAVPRDVKAVCLKASERLSLETILVANSRVELLAGYGNVSAVRVDGGPDVADRYIAERAVKGDVVVTADIPLAALLVPNGVIVIDPRGEEYTAESIGERLSVRNFMDGLRGAGVETGGHGTFGPRDKQAFANSLDRILTRALRRA
jgi:uncharacterized protein